MSDVQSYSELNAYLWIKMAFICAAVLCGLVCLPQLHKHRQHPVLKYRTISVYVITIIAAYLLNIIEILKSEISDISVANYRVLFICYAFCCSIVYGAITGIGIRFYSLVLTRYVQGQLMDRRTCYDGKFYRRVASQIRWCRYFTLENTAFKTFFGFTLFYAVSLVPSYCVASDAAIESVMKGQPSFLRMWMGIVILTAAIVSLG